MLVCKQVSGTCGAVLWTDGAVSVGLSGRRAVAGALPAGATPPTPDFRAAKPPPTTPHSHGVVMFYRVQRPPAGPTVRRGRSFLGKGGGAAPSTLSECAGWRFPGYVRVRLLRRESSTREEGGWWSTRWVGGEGGGFKKKCRGGGGEGRALLEGEGANRGNSRAVAGDVKAVRGAVTGGWRCSWCWCWGTGTSLG